MISQEIIAELWTSGFTLTRRLQDPTNLRADEIPATRAYQWMHLEHDKALFTGTGWAPVPHDRHPGRFAPWGTTGNIEWNGLGLFEKPKFGVEAEHAASHARAHQNVADWVERTAAEFSGHVSVGTSPDDVTTAVVGDKTLENVTKIPKDMQPFLADIFAERDRLGDLFARDPENPEVADFAQPYTRAIDADPTAPKWPTLNAIILPRAIENVRKTIASPKEA